MRGLLVQCEDDGVVESFAVVHEAGTTVRTFGTHASCPVCGKMSTVLDGSYHTAADGVLHARLQLTPNQAEALQEAFRKVERIAEAASLNESEARARIEQVLREAAADSPEVVQQYRAFTEGAPRKVWSVAAKAIMGTLAAVGAFNTVGEFGDRAAELIRYFLAQ